MKKMLFLLVFFVIMIVLEITAFGAEIKVKEQYREDTGSYRYYLDEDNYFEASARLEAVVNNIVRISFNDYVVIMVYKDGKPMQFASGDYIFGDGEYSVIIKNGDNIGRIKFIMDTVTPENINIEDKFYNEISLTQSYDFENNHFIESMGDKFNIYSDVPNYAVTDKNVKIMTDESKKAYITVTKDGKEIDFISGKTFSEEGWYCISIVYEEDNSTSYYYDENSTIDDISEEEVKKYSEKQIEEELNNLNAGENYETELNAVADIAEYKFQIIKSEQRKMGYINPPQDYEIYSVALDGKNLALKSKKSVECEKDGKYSVVFKSDKKLPDRKMTVVIDRQAPILEFEGINSDGNAKKRVKIIGGYEDALISVRCGGVPVQMVENIIDKDGLYFIEAKDNAGNKSVYMLNVRVPFEINFIVVLIIFIILAGGIGIYISYAKNNFKIR